MSAADAFDRMAATTPSPMVIVTAADGVDRDGCLVGFSTQCSIDPLHYLVCLSVKNRTYEIARRAPALVVHPLHDTPENRALARLFGEETGFDTDKLRRCRWAAGPRGVPVLEDCDWFGGAVLARDLDFGDHAGFVVAVEAAATTRAELPYLEFPEVSDLEAGNPA